uniref:Uncharacterized protein n=1 Tax=Arundo donax TaxID=35708 RepID=A0A0A9BH32_ARUDO
MKDQNMHVHQEFDEPKRYFSTLWNQG